MMLAFFNPVIRRMMCKGFSQDFEIAINTQHITTIRKTQNGNAAIKVIGGNEEYITVAPYEKVLDELMNN